MTVDQAISSITSLTPKDQFRVVKAIWDNLPEEFGTELSLPQHEDLDRRWEEYKSDPSSALSKDDFREQVRLALRR